MCVLLCLRGSWINCQDWLTCFESLNAHTHVVFCSILDFFVLLQMCAMVFDLRTVSDGVHGGIVPRVVEVQLITGDEMSFVIVTGALRCW